MKPKFEVLSPDERAQIHERTLHVLATAGVGVDTPVGRKVLRDAGAQVDEDHRIVRLPPELVERCLETSRRELTLGGRRPGWSHPTMEGKTTLVSAGEATLTRDRLTGEVRPGTREDWEQSARLIDALDEVGVYWTMITSPGSGWDSRKRLGDEVGYMADIQRWFSKHVQDSSFNPDAMPWLLEILDLVFDGRDEVVRRHPFSFLLTPISPLVVEPHGAEACLALSGWDIPVSILPMPMAGTTAPGTFAGTVLMGNCDVLASLCLVQAAEPGRPIIYAPILATMNLRTGGLLGGAGNDSLLAAATEMANFYGLPSCTAGFDSGHIVPDIQAGYEKALSILVPLLSGPDLFVGPGTFSNASVYSPEQLLIDMEIFRTCESIRGGITVEDRLLDEAIMAVGPGGNFLGERSTRRVRDELFMPNLGWHSSRHTWEVAGRPSMLDEAREAVDVLLADHEPLPLDDDVEQELQRLVQRAREATP